MKYLIWVLLMCFSVSLLGCGALKGQEFKVEAYTSKVDGMGTADVKTPLMVADLKVSDTRFVTNIKGSNVLSVGAIERKLLTAAIQKHGGDVVVEPRYQVVINNWGYTGIVSGYMGHYKNIRRASKADKAILKKASGHSDKKEAKKATKKLNIFGDLLPKPAKSE